MARVPAKMYRNITQHAYTRREYMGGVPGLRILQFHSGNKNADFPYALHLVPEERGQIRHTALEAMRQTAVRYMDKKAGREYYHLQVRIYPHHVLRQNKQASGAGADRVSMGMRLAFGKPIGTAARIAAGQPIVTIRTTEKGVPHAKDALRKAYNKIAMPCHIDTQYHWVDEATLEASVAAAADELHKEQEAEEAAAAEAAHEAQEAAEGEAEEGEEAEEAEAAEGEEDEEKE